MTLNHRTPCVAVKAFIVRNKKLLINKPTNGQFWAVPGGHIEVGETPEEALRRELKEEIGHDDVTIGQPIVVWRKIVAPPDYFNWLPRQSQPASSTNQSRPNG